LVHGAARLIAVAVIPVAAAFVLGQIATLPDKLNDPRAVISIAPPGFSGASI
jgi:hypothetical protein